MICLDASSPASGKQQRRISLVTRVDSVTSNALEIQSAGPGLNPRSTNHKADIINDRLSELKIAYKIMLNCEHCRNELIKTVRSDHKSDSTTYQKKQDVYPSASLSIIRSVELDKTFKETLYQAHKQFCSDHELAVEPEENFGKILRVRDLGFKMEGKPLAREEGTGRVSS